MHSCRILLDRSNNSEEHPCHSLIPIDLESEGLDVRILTCSMLEHGAGYSMINIFDGSGKLEEGKYDSEGGSCSITRMSKDRYMAMVVNKRCLLSGLINSSGCFLSSAIPRTDTLIEWTIIGPDSCAIHELFEKMRRNGYSFEVLSSGSVSISATLTPKQESYFNTAMDLGYYDIPKRITLDELSKVLGCSKSTLNVALRTAENSIFRFYRDLCRSHRWADALEHVRSLLYTAATRITFRDRRSSVLPMENDHMAIDEEKKRKTLSYRWLVFAVLAVAYFFVYFHRTTGGAISDNLQDFFGVGTASVALLASAYLYSYTLMQIPSGILTDRMGPRKAATIFIFLIAVGSLLSAYSATSGDFALMIAGKFIIGIGAAVVYIPIMKILAVWFRKNEFASMSGILLLVGNVGGIAAATPMVIMMDSLGIQNTYIVLAVVTAVIAGLCWLLVRNHPSEMGLPSIEEIVSDETGQPVGESTLAKMGTVEALKMTFTSGTKFWSLAIWFFFMYGTIMLWQASQAGSFYKSIYGFTAGEAGLMVTMVGIGMVFGCPLAGTISDKVLHSRKKVLIIGTAVYTAIWAAIWLTAGMDGMDSIAIQAAINFLFGFFGGFFVVSYAQIKELYPIAMAGTSTAALNLFPFAGGAILITIAGFIVSEKTLTEFQNLWMLAFAMMVVALVCVILSQEKTSENS